MQLIQVCIALCPLFGLMGTVTGMIEVFQIMAFTGGGDARSMAGVSKSNTSNYGWNGFCVVRCFSNDMVKK